MCLGRRFKFFSIVAYLFHHFVPTLVDRECISTSELFAKYISEFGITLFRTISEVTIRYLSTVDRKTWNLQRLGRL